MTHEVDAEYEDYAEYAEIKAQEEDSRITTGPRERMRDFINQWGYKNEWELIPEEDKKIFTEWLKQIDLDEMFYTQSLQMPTQAVEYLKKQKLLPSVPKFPTEEDLDKKEFSDYEVAHLHDAKEFMEVFLTCHDKVTPILNAKKLQIGFELNGELHSIRLSSLYPLWRPLSQKELAAKYKEEKLAVPEKADEHLGKIFDTTRLHSFGPGWAGILELNIPELSTITNGSQHAVQLPTARYKIEWTNLKTRARTTVLYENYEVFIEMEQNKIRETDGHYSAPSAVSKSNYTGYEDDQGRKS